MIHKSAAEAADSSVQRQLEQLAVSFLCTLARSTMRTRAELLAQGGFQVIVASLRRQVGACPVPCCRACLALPTLSFALGASVVVTQLAVPNLEWYIKAMG